MSRKQTAVWVKAISILTATLALSTCDAFKAGLGPKIDVSDPSLDISSIANGAYLKGTVTLSGSVSDDVEVKAVTLFVDINSVRKNSLGAALADNKWSVQLDTTNASYGPEVQADLTLRVTDSADKYVDKKLVVYFDNKKPDMTSMTPTAADLGTSDYAICGPTAISGSVRDGLGVAKVELTTGAGASALTYTDSANAATWSIDLDGAYYLNAAQLAVPPSYGAINGATYVSAGLYSVPYSVRATDMAGNVSDAVAGVLYVTPDGSPIVDIHGQTPAIKASILYPNPPDLGNLGAWQSSTLSPGATIKFRAFDMDGLDTSAPATYALFVPGSRAAALAAGTIPESELRRYIYTESGAVTGTVAGVAVSGACKSLVEADIQMLQLTDGSSIPQKADFSLGLPSALTAVGDSMPEFGEYLLLVRASDYAGSFATKLAVPPATSPASAARLVPASPDYISVYVTEGAPLVTVSSPANGAFVQSLSAAGMIDDALGPLAVLVAVDGVDQGSVAPTGAGTSRPWSYTYSGPVLSDGLHSAAFRGRNVAGTLSVAAATLQFNVDNTPPVATVQGAYPASAAGSPNAFVDQASAAPGGVENVVNGVVRFKGLASDTAALASASWAIRRVTNPATWALDPTPVASGTFAPAAMSIWSLDVDTASYVDGDYYVLSVQATDGAGNSSAAGQRTFRVLQSSDLPVFSLTNMTASAATSADAKNNLLTTNIRLDATVSDDDRVDPAMIKVLVDPTTLGLPSPSGTPINTGYLAATGTTNPTTGSVSFSYSFTASGVGTGFALPTEGRHFLYLVANDDSAYKSGKGSAAVTIGPIWFAVDTHQPQISFDQAGGIFVSSSQAISGTVSSANALDATTPFTIQPQGGSVSSPALSPDASNAGSHAWSYNLDVSSLSDGALLVSAIAKDEFGLSSGSAYSVTVDKTAPAMTVTNAAQVFSDVNGLSLVGTAMDVTSGVASMTASVFVDSAGSHGADVTAQTAITLNATTGTPNTTGSWSLDLSALATGRYFVVPRVTDKAGNHYDPAEFIVSVDKDVPVATIDNVLSAPVNGAAYNASSAVGDSWSGSGSDAFFLRTQVYLDGVQLGSDIAVAGAWTVTRTWASIADGSHTLAVKVTDQGGHATTAAATFVKDTAAPTLAITAPESASWLSATPYTIRGSADDGSGMGVDHVYYIAANAAPDHAADSSATVLSTWSLATGAASWNASVDLAALGEGAKRLWIKSVDKAGNWNALASFVNFNVDLAPPRATETSHGAAVIQSRTDLVFAGKADDAAITALRAAASVQLTYSKDGAAPVDVTPAVDLDGADGIPGNADDGSWTWTLAADPNGNGDHSADGLYVIALTVTDAAGKTASVTRTAQIDTTPPLLAIAAPAAGEATAVATYDISGTARDTGGVGFDGIADAEYNMNGAGWNAMNSLVATINWAQAGVSLGAGEGAKTLQVRATDKLGNQSSSSVTFYYDLAPPSLSEATVGTTDTKYIKADLAFGGKASDSNALASLQVSINGVTQVPDIAVDADGVNDIPGDGDDNSWSWTFPIAAKADGTYALVFTAKDIANKTTTLARTVVLDTAAPTVSGIASLAGWKIQASQAVAGNAADATSGIDRVEYRVDSGTWNNLTGTTSFSGTIAFPEGSSTLQIRAADKAGNYSVVEAATNSQQTVQIDLSDPTATITSPPTNPVLNGASDLSVTVTVTDAAAGSGLASAAAYAYDIPGASAKALHSVATSGSSQSLVLTVPAADLFSLSGGNPGTVHKICVVATDAAGRGSAVASLNFTLDKKLPVATFSSHAEGAEVNRLITLSGTSSDENGVASCVVQVHNRASGLWENAPTGTAAGSTAWSLADFDTAGFSTIDGAYDDTLLDSKSQLRLRALATDAAGNQASVERVLVVDQNSDRPIIRLTNLATLDGTSKLKMSRTVYGTISDDDGYSIGEGASEKKLELYVSEDGINWASVTIDGGSWSCNASPDDGVKYLYFRATDAKEKVFTTDTSATESLDEPRVWMSSAPPYWHDRVTFMVDTIPPKIALATPVLVDRTGPDYSDFDGSVELADGMAFGGTTTSFAIRVLASDANGIASVKIKVPGAAGSPFTANPMGADVGQPTYTRFETGPISVAAAPDGAVSLTIDVTDNSELTTSTSRTILIDNTAPTITFINPSVPAAMINGGQDIAGAASDSGSGLATVTYGLGIDYSNGGDPALGGTKYMWTIPFVDSVAYHAGTESFHDTYTGSDIYILPVVVRATDAAGNYRETAPMALAGVSRGSTTTLQSNALMLEPYKSRVKVGQVILVGANARLVTAYSSAAGTIDWAGAVGTGETSVTIYESCLRINPNADLPTASMSYPTNGTTMGGNVRMYGTALDDDGVSEVWMQIDTNGDGFFDVADNAIGGWFNADQGKKVDGSANWSQTINESHEFDPAGAVPKQINVRVRAKDIYNTWGPWSTPSLVLVDKNVPQFGSASAFFLEKEGDPSTTINYTPGMIVRGDWILKGSIEDDGAISAITISGDVSGTYARDSAVDAFADITHADPPDAAMYKRVDLAVPLKTSLMGSYGTLTFTLTAVDNAQPVSHETIQSLRILYDNQVPTAALVSPTTDNAIVVQSNGWYKIKGRSGDVGSDIDRVEVYFLRRGRLSAAQDRIYNPASNDAHALLSSITLDANGSPLKSGTADSYTTTSLTDDALDNNPLIHKGQKVLIGSYLRTIDTYTFAAGSGTITWLDGAITGAITGYSIRLAIQIDNKSAEVRDSGTGLLTTDDGDGYLEYLKQDAGNDYTWYVDIDSLDIPDGPIEIHYVAYDTAGNAVHVSTPYKTTAGYYSVKNNGPRVASIQLGTDIDGVNGIEESEKFAFNYASDSAATETISAAFKATDKLFLKPIVTNGNGDLLMDISAGGYTATAVSFRTGGSTPGIELIDANLTSAGQGSRTFALTIWDSTQETVPGTNSQSIARGVTFVVANVDGTDPRAIVRPLYWNGAGSNSLFGNAVANGHIDIASNASNGTGDADVSGKVSFRGTAFDDARIVNVYAYIGNGTDNIGAFAFSGIADTRSDGSRLYYRLAHFDGTWHGTGDAPLTDGWQFTVPDSVIDQSGHRIAWQLDWNSALVSGGAATDRVVRILVEDKAGNPNSGSTDVLAGTGARTVTTLTAVPDLQSKAIAIGNPIVLRNGSEEAYFTRVKAYDSANGVVTLLSDSVPTDKASYTIYLDGGDAPSLQFDVVPYVTDITRKLPFADRVPDVASPNPLYGKKGYFPVLQGETGIEISGFNLPYTNATSIAGNGSIVVGSTTFVAGDLTAATSTRDKLTVTIPAGLQTGAVTVTTNIVASINNANSAGHDYNVDSVGSFADDRYLYIDQTLPTISIAPFGRRYNSAARDADKVLSASPYNDNILMSGSDRQGHIEYAEHSSYSSIPAVIAPATDKLAAAAHGLATGQIVQLKATTAPTLASAAAVSAATQYYAIRLDADSFMLASSMDSALVGTVGSSTATSITAASLVGRTQLSSGSWKVVLPSMDAVTLSSFNAATGELTWVGGLGAQVGSFVVLPSADLVDFATTGFNVSVADPEVSGEVILRGKAYDDQRIESITATISGPSGETFQGDADGGAFTIYNTEPDGSGGLTTHFNSSATYGWTMALEESGTEYKLSNARIDSGHEFNWKFTWNSSKISTQAAANMTVVLTIKDYNSVGQSRTVVQSVDVVPYISSVARSGLTTNRGRYGAYTLQQGETSLTLNGFNLRRGSAGDSVRVARSGTSGTGTNLTATGGGADPYTSLVVTAGSNSGWLTASTNNVASVNNLNDNGQTWNQETSAGSHAVNWTDDRYFRIWQVNQTFAGSTGASYASMTQDTANGVLVAAWVAESANSVYYNTSTGTTQIQAFRIYDPQKFTDINMYPGESLLALGLLANYQGGAWGTAPTIDVAGGLAVYTANITNFVTPTATAIPTSRDWDGSGATYNNNAYPIEALNNDQQMSQFEEPRVARYNSGTLNTAADDWIHVAYFDKYTSAVKVSSFQDTNATSLAQPKGWIVLDGATDAQDTVGTAGWGRGLVPTGTGLARSLNAGYTPNYESVAIDVDEAGIPAVVYYDNVGHTLRIARCNSSSAFAIANWTRQEVLKADDPYRSYAGQHVMMKFDPVGNLHVVFFRNGYPYYAFAPNVDATTTDYAFDYAVRIDDMGYLASIGEWPDITMDGTMPAVSYLTASVGSMDGLKYAAPRHQKAAVSSSFTTSVTSNDLIGNASFAIGDRITFPSNTAANMSRTITSYDSATGTVGFAALAGAPIAGTKFIVYKPGAWDYEVIPASANVQKDRTNIEVRKAGTDWGDTAISYRANRIELVYLKEEQ